MPFRNTTGIVTNGPNADPALDADMIIGAMVVGFTIERLQRNEHVQFDLEPLAPGGNAANWNNELNQLINVAQRIANIAANYLTTHGGPAASYVHVGAAAQHQRGAVIMGVYGLAGQAPPSQADIQDPTNMLSNWGRELYDFIKTYDQAAAFQYIGRGAYTGFVDNNNKEGDIVPVGPMSTVRAGIPDLAPNTTIAGWHPRWLPHSTSPVWARRERRNQAGSFVPWGLINGDLANSDPSANEPNTRAAGNHADQRTDNMEIAGMPFLNDAVDGTVSGYTHGMVQAIYKAYHLGPSCRPYEVTVGRDTTKLASCFGCTMFMTATGYPPSSIHLGRAESWAPYYGDLSDPHGRYEHKFDHNVLRDLNGSFAEHCDIAIRLGLAALPQATLAAQYHPSHDGLTQMLGGAFDKTDHIACTLFLDALTVHDKEVNRISRLLGV